MAAYSNGNLYNDTAFSTWMSNNTNVATVEEFPTNNYTAVMGISPGNVTITVQDGNPNPPYIPYQCFPTGTNCPLAEDYLGGYSMGTIVDPTPVVNSVSPGIWPAGTINLLVTVGGTGFGTAPNLSFSDTTITLNSYVSRGDMQIQAYITIPSTAPNETVTVTVTSTGYNGSGFIGVPGEPASGSNTATVVAFTAPAPRILLNGTDVTGTTQNVVVGQQIALTTSVSLPNGVAITGNNWSVPGTIVGGYVNAAGNAPPDTTGGFTAAVVFANPSITFYWVSAGQSMNVTYSYCLNTGSCSPTATATFNVAGPTGIAVVNQPPIAVVNVRLNNGSPELRLGDGVPSDPTNYGIVLQASATLPSNAGANSTYSWVQLISRDTIRLLSSSGTQSCVPNGLVGNPGSPELDNIYPYSTGYYVDDSPSSGLTSALGELSQAFSATMYLTWDPALPTGCTPATPGIAGTCTSIPVPLGSVPWQWSGDAIDVLSTTQGQNGTAWILGCGPRTANQFQPSASYPQWQNTFSNGTLGSTFTCTTP